MLLGLESVYPHPTPNEFEIAFTIADEYYEDRAGIANVLTSRVLDLVDDKDRFLKDESTILEVGFLFNDIEDDFGEVDPTLSAAFSNGFFAIMPVLDLTYRCKVLKDTQARTIKQFYDTQREVTPDTQLFRIEARDLLTNLGKRGLRYMGEPAQRALGSWAREVYPDQHKSRVFKLGAGAAVATTWLGQECLNSGYLNDVFAANFDQEYEQFISKMSK